MSEGDIDRIERHLGVAFDSPRRDVLKCGESIDVQACPGSGKTTLLVAKLAILAGKWTERRQGICVLSHTNVAREQIEQKLASTSAGQYLLEYPHFVGTIHNFVNHFLALPRLRSDGKAVQLIDDAVCGAKCRSLLHRNGQYQTARSFLRSREQFAPNRTITNLRFEGPDLELASAAGKLPCGAGTPSCAQLLEIKKRVADEGYWRYDDMFAVAARQLKEWPEVMDIVRQRFPAVFIDEMQDTSQMQNAILGALFPVTACVVRQRFGDSNQAIYDGGQTAAVSDTFPCANRLREIPNSKRFGGWIAGVADPLAHVPVAPALKGDGPGRSGCQADWGSMRPTVFVFSQASCQAVLPAFGSLLMEIFSDVDLHNGFFRAIGHVGKVGSDGKHLPKSVHDYWSAFDSDSTRPEPRPSTLAGYVQLARRQKVLRGRSADAVETAARGIVELLRLVGVQLPQRLGRAHQRIQNLFGSLGMKGDLYNQLAWRWCISEDGISDGTWGAEVQRVRELLKPVLGGRWSGDADEFLEWSNTPIAEGGLPKDNPQPAPPNVFRLARGKKSVDIHVGTIHSAKGQTHTGTLVLETFYHEHDLTDLLDWLCGKKRGGTGKTNKRREERLRLVYTAMTRPTHLLCLAIRREVFGSDLSTCSVALTLRKKGWGITDLDSAPQGGHS